jgi:hypothetical protein
MVGDHSGDGSRQMFRRLQGLASINRRYSLESEDCLATSNVDTSKVSNFSRTLCGARQEPVASIMRIDMPNQKRFDVN